jgi:hypothetical protein
VSKIVHDFREGAFFVLNFAPLALSDRERYSTLYALCPEACSQYSFFALWGWNQTDPIELAWTEAPLCWVRSGGHKSGLLAPVGDWASVDWTEAFGRLDAWLGASGLSRRLLDVPETLIRALPESLLPKFRLIELRDEWEYIYSVRELVDLKGGKYAAKRAHVKAFFFDNPEWEYRALLPEDFPELLAFQSEWCARRECKEDPLLCAEDLAVRRALEFWNILPMTGATLSVGGKVAAYTIGEELSPDTIDIRFEKAASDYTGIYQALNKLFLERQGQAYRWVNREEDMGSEGLRKAKMSYHPGRFLKKYRLDWD